MITAAFISGLLIGSGIIMVITSHKRIKERQRQRQVEYRVVDSNEKNRRNNARLVYPIQRSITNGRRSY